MQKIFNLRVSKYCIIMSTAFSRSVYVGDESTWATNIRHSHAISTTLSVVRRSLSNTLQSINVKISRVDETYTGIHSSTLCLNGIRLPFSTSPNKSLVIKRVEERNYGGFT